MSRSFKRRMFELLLFITAAPVASAASLSLGSATAVAGSTVAIPLSFSSQGAIISSLGWTFTFSPADITSVRLTPSAALIGAGKSLYCHATPGAYACILVGMNSSQVADGNVATATVTVSSSSSNFIPISITDGLAATPAGDSAAVSAVGGSITVPTPAAITNLSCTASTLAISGSTNCAIELSNAAPQGGVSVALGLASTQSVTAIMPSAISIAAGASSATFNVQVTTAAASTTVNIVATLGGSSRTAAINITVPVGISLAPHSISLTAGQMMQFTAAVTGATNTAVTWNLSPPMGVMSSTGRYSAPVTLTSPQTVTVTATSVADPTRFATATITLVPVVSVALSPASAIVTVGQTRQFIAVVGGTTNTAMTWSLSSTVGSISSTGLYTAPVSVVGPQSVTVRATSMADPTKSANATIVVNPVTPADTVAPSISSVVATSSTTSAVITWNTNELATSRVNYGTSASSLTSNVSSASLQTSHSLNITGLQPGTRYYFRITSADAAGNTAVSPATGTSTFTTGTVAAQDLAGSWGFNESSGTTTADGSGGNLNGTLTNASWGAGKYGSALSFNGTSSWVTVPDSPKLDLTNAITLEAWVKPTTFTPWQTIAIKEASGRLAYVLYLNAGRPVADVYINGYNYLTGPSAIPLNAWSHVAMTFNGSTLRLYVNGVQVASRAVSGSVAASSSPFRIGGNKVWGEYFKGFIDDVRVYNRALTQSEIQADRITPIQ